MWDGKVGGRNGYRGIRGGGGRKRGFKGEGRSNRDAKDGEIMKCVTDTW